MWPESSVNVARVGDLTWSNDRIRAGVRVKSWPGGEELNKMKTQGSGRKRQESTRKAKLRGYNIQRNKISRHMLFTLGLKKKTTMHLPQTLFLTTAYQHHAGKEFYQPSSTCTVLKIELPLLRGQRTQQNRHLVSLDSLCFRLRQ